MHLIVQLCLSALLAGVVSAHPFDAFFEEHCLDCHGPDKQKGELRLDTLAPPASATADSSAATWTRIADVVEMGEMPPARKPRPPSGEVDRLLDWIGAELAASRPPVLGLRRMNRVEYEHTVQDLLGIDTALLDLLPRDNQVQGFDNVATGLGLSPVLMERYLDAADAAFEGVIRRIPPLPPATLRARTMEQEDNIDSVRGNKGGVIERAGAFVDFTAGWPPTRIDAARPREDGLYRCRFAVWPHDPGTNRTLAVAVFVGPLFGAGKREFVGVYDVTGTPRKPRVVEFTARMREGHTFHILPWVWPEHVTWRDKHEKRPGVGVVWAETHGPLDQDFPSLAQRRLFGETDSISLKEAEPIWMRHRKGVKRHVVHSEDPRGDLARILGDLAPRAFRRPVDAALVDSFVRLALARLDAGGSFEDAARAGVSAILCSPHFLLLNHDPEVDDYTIASRLSYFLWSSMPDDELLRLAAAGKLRDPATRRAQVDRMLSDPRTERFVTHFTDQWLDLRDLEFTTPDKRLFPEFDPLLLRSMEAETRGFFRHVLAGNLGVMAFVDSDFAYINQRLAEHYGIPGVRGHERLRLVPLPEDSLRGGVLAQASVLKVTANGTSTSPVLRGAWVLDKILGQPPSPPPPGVPLVEPDIRGAVTVREQLAKHREDESCNRCHVRIDPPGFALEQFNAIGGQREWYRSLGGEGKGIRHVQYKVGLDVHAGGRWADGRRFEGFADFRKQLAADPDAVARGIARKLLVYGTGRPVTAADRQVVEAVVEAARADDFGLRSMIHAVAQSEMFLRP